MLLFTLLHREARVGAGPVLPQWGAAAAAGVALVPLRGKKMEADTCPRSLLGQGSSCLLCPCRLSAWNGGGRGRLRKSKQAFVTPPNSIFPVRLQSQTLTLGFSCHTSGSVTSPQNPDLLSGALQTVLNGPEVKGNACKQEEADCRGTARIVPERWTCTQSPLTYKFNILDSSNYARCLFLQNGVLCSPCDED